VLYRTDPRHLGYLRRFQLTDAGREVVAHDGLRRVRRPEVENDGRTIPRLILGRLANAITTGYSLDEVRHFALDQGLPRTYSSESNYQEDPPGYLLDVLSQLDRGTPDDRARLRSLLAAYLTGRLDACPTAWQRAEFLQQLARAGWHLRDEGLVIGEFVPAEITEDPPISPPVNAVDPAANIFLVHGREMNRVQEVARLIERCTGRDAVILHEQANRGRTLIEKFEHNAAKAAYAVVLLTADDVGRLATDNPSKQRPRARQNVVLELGFFFSQLGRDHVAVLIDPGVERPSDIDGLVYIEFDPQGSWKLDLLREFPGAGLPVDLSRAI
jgi:predicted nucleotide-binding protein